MNKFEKKKQKIFGVLIVSGVLTIYFAIYAFMYLEGSFCVGTQNFGILSWCSTGPGAFFPFPEESGPFMATNRHESLIDYLIYIAIISTNLVLILPVIFLGLTIFAGWILFQYNQTENKK